VRDDRARPVPVGYLCRSTPLGYLHITVWKDSFMTVVVTAVFTPATGSRDRLVDALQQAIPAVHEEQGCLLYAIHDAADGSIVMIEKWASDSDLAAHAEGPAVARLNNLVDGLTAKPVVVTTMAPLPAGTHDQGAL
jgi:quinol monooxygenase YgiN